MVPLETKVIFQAPFSTSMTMGGRVIQFKISHLALGVCWFAKFSVCFFSHGYSMHMLFTVAYLFFCLYFSSELSVEFFLLNVESLMMGGGGIYCLL